MPKDSWRDQNTDYPLCDWRYAVDNDETRLGYWDWVDSQIEQED